MWNTKSKGSTDITMTEGDYGVSLPFFIYGVTIDDGDSVLFTVKTEKNGDTVFTKDFTDVTDNIVDLVLTEDESALLEAGTTYVYSLDWYSDGVFMYCLVNNAKLKVEDKI